MPALISAGIGAGGSLLSGILGKGGAEKAAQAQLEAARVASATQLQMFNQNRQDLLPFRELGYSGVDALKSTMGLNGQPTRDPYDTGAIQRALSASEQAFNSPYRNAALPAFQNYLKLADQYRDAQLPALTNYIKLADQYRDKQLPTLENYMKGADSYRDQIYPHMQGYIARATDADSQLAALKDRVQKAVEPGSTGMPSWFEEASRNFTGTPDYAFARDEAMKNARTGLAKGGQIGSGGAVRELARVSGGLASQNYDKYRTSALAQYLPGQQAVGNLIQQQGSNALAEGKLDAGTLQSLYENFMNEGKTHYSAIGDQYTNALNEGKLHYSAIGDQYTNALNEGKLHASAISDQYTNDLGYAQQLQNYAKLLGGNFQEYFNRLTGISGIGQNATNTTANLGASAANNISSLQASAGNALAQSSIAGSNALSNAVQGVASNAQRYFTQQSSPYNTNNNSGNSGTGNIGNFFTPNPGYSGYSGGFTGSTMTGPSQLADYSSYSYG